MKNFVIDLILIALFVAELSFYYLPKILHEILAIVAAVLIIIHVGINFRRFLDLFKNMSPRKFFLVEVDIALALGTVIIFVTGVCMSNYLFPDFAHYSLRRNMTIHNLHTSAPYIMTILIGMHIGLHLREIKLKVLNYFGLEEIFQRRRKIFHAIILFLSAIGILGLFLNRFFDRILMKHIFSTPATDLPIGIFALMLIGGIIFFALLTYIAVKKFFKR